MRPLLHPAREFDLFRDRSGEIRLITGWGFRRLSRQFVVRADGRHGPLYFPVEEVTLLKPWARPTIKEIHDAP